MSDKGNGYIFLVDRSNEFVEIDSKDAKFNETFSEYRERQGKITAAPFIDPDLKEISEDNHEKRVSFIDPDLQVESTRIAKNDENHNGYPVGYYGVLQVPQ
jgi:hypothetical protein